MGRLPGRSASSHRIADITDIPALCGCDVIPGVGRTDAPNTTVLGR